MKALVYTVQCSLKFANGAEVRQGRYRCQSLRYLGSDMRLRGMGWMNGEFPLILGHEATGVARSGKCGRRVVKP